jgi:hypothetical protein
MRSYFQPQKVAGTLLPRRFGTKNPTATLDPRRVLGCGYQLLHMVLIALDSYPQICVCPAFLSPMHITADLTLCDLILGLYLLAHALLLMFFYTILLL